jgi:hypothetical protein
VKGRLHTRYAPVRRSLIPKNYTPRLACVKPAASVHPEPGSNSSSYIIRDLRLFVYLTEGLVVFSNLSILLLLFFCLSLSIETAVNSICLGTLFFLFFTSFNSLCVSLEAGAKLQLLFVTGKNFLKFFLENLISISSLFLSSMSRIVARLAGCKSNKLFYFSQAFLNLFLKINFLLISSGLSMY